MAVLKQSCCGCSLDHGSRIIAIFYIVTRILAILFCSAFLIILNAIFDFICNKKITVIGEHIDEEFYCDFSNPNYNAKTIASKLLISGLVTSIILVIMDSFLLYGINTKRRGFFVPWIIGQILNLIGAVIIAVLAFSGHFGYAGFAHMTPGIILGLIDCGLGIYFLLIIISYFQELKDGRSGFIYPNPTNITYTFPTTTTSGIPVVVNYGHEVGQIINGEIVYPTYPVHPPEYKEFDATSSAKPTENSSGFRENNPPPPYDTGIVNKGYLAKDM